MSNQRVSDEEQQLRKRARRRLVGSVFTVLVAAVVLPFVLASKPKPVASNVAVYLPPGTGGNAVAAPAPAPAPAANVPPPPIAAAASQPAVVAPVAKVKPSPAATPEKADKASAPAVVEKKPPVAKKAATDPVKKEGHWVLQIGTFRDIKHAGQLKSKLQSKGLHAYTEAVEIHGEQEVRLRIGPYDSRDAALHVRDRLADLKLSGIALNVR